MLTLASSALLLAPAEAQAYIGPGVGLTAIGAVLAFLGAILFAIFGFVWYPLKRLLAAWRGRGAKRLDAEKAPLQ